MLEEYEHVVHQGGRILSEVRFVWYTPKGFHITALHPEGKGAKRAM